MTDPDAYTDSARNLRDRERAELAACPPSPIVYLGDGVPRWEWEIGDEGDGA